MSNLIHNERIKLLATSCNTIASAAVAVGVATPLANLLYYQTLRVAPTLIGGLIWIGASAVINCFGQYALGGLQDD